MSDTLFPLRLTNFEDYAFRDNSSEHPMVISLRIVLDGTLNQEAFRESFGKALAENPLLRAVVRPSGLSKSWHLLDNPGLPLSVERYSSNELPFECPPRALDIKHEAGVWFDLRIAPDRSVLIAYFHHACCDGIASIRFIGDVFAHYGQQTAPTADQRPEIRSIDPLALVKRGSSRMPGDCADRRAPILHTLYETAKLFCRRSFRFVSKRTDTRPDDAAASNVIDTRVLPRPVLKGLKKLASDRAVSVNDLCMTVFLQQLESWSAKDSSGQRDLFRILMPVSMRNPEHDEISAANVVSYCFHSYHRRDMDDFDSLLKRVHTKSQQMVNRNEGAAMLCGFAVVRRCPGLFWLARKTQPDFATAVMTNVGEVRRLFGNRFPLKGGRAVAGDVVIHRVDGVAPVRSNTNITMSCGTYGGEMIVHISRNAAVFSESDAAFFVNSIAERLTELAKACTPEQPASNTDEKTISPAEASVVNTQ